MTKKNSKSQSKQSSSKKKEAPDVTQDVTKLGDIQTTNASDEKVNQDKISEMKKALDKIEAIEEKENPEKNINKVFKEESNSITSLNKVIKEQKDIISKLREKYFKLEKENSKLQEEISKLKKS